MYVRMEDRDTEWGIIGIVLWVVIISLILFGLTMMSEEHYKNSSMEVTDLTPLGVEIHTEMGGTLVTMEVYNPYPKVQVGWWVAVGQGADGQWQVERYWEADPR